MHSDLQIAQGLLAICLEADHKPGKVQFTKYLYLLDYCNWRFRGCKVTSLPWKFYHYGPWCEEVEACMTRLAADHAFQWRETEASFIRSVEIPAHRFDLTTNSFMSQIVGWFKDRDLKVLLEITYSQTEPMVLAKRGDRLDFSTVPVDKRMPQFFPKEHQPETSYRLHPERLKKMEAFRAQTEKLKQKARERMAFRESESYRQAAQMLKEEFTASNRLPEMNGSMTFEAANGLATE
jgi:hypothetical protein